jgi:D-beta-D-heptose 7-phosphate kinase/D-beta-D-heptose 1-phosphate adenosyltransferase
MKKVWVNGTFDIVHIGHIRLLEHASSFGVVRVGLDTDKRVSEKKGETRPFNSLSDRMDFITSIRYVDSVVSFDTDDELINRIYEWKPDIMVIEFFKKIEGVSTTKILNDGK